MTIESKLGWRQAMGQRIFPHHHPYCFELNCPYYYPYSCNSTQCLFFPCFRVVSLWRESLGKVNQKAAQSLADPTEYENLFQGLKEQFKAEQFLRPQRRNPIPAASYPNVPVCICLDDAAIGTLLVF